MTGSRGARGKGRGAVSSPLILVSVGAAVMVVLLAVALGAVPGPRPVADPGPPLPTVALPVLPSPSLSVRKGEAGGPSTPPDGSPRPSRPPSASVPVTRGAGASPTGGRSPQPTGPTPGAPEVSVSTLTTVQVTGTYRLVDAFHDAFIGEIRVTNLSPDPQRWTVRMAVTRGRLVSAWVEGAAQPGVSGSHGRYTVTGGADLAAGASVRLRFHFDGSGRATRPAECTVNGSGCAGI